MVHRLCSEQPQPCACWSTEHFSWVALSLFAYTQYILWQDCSVLLFFLESSYIIF